MQPTIDLQDWGYNEYIQTSPDSLASEAVKTEPESDAASGADTAEIDAPVRIARVIGQFRELSRIVSASGEALATVTGRFRHTAQRPADYPCAGDWVECSGGENGGTARISHVLPRRTWLSRKTAGQTTVEQLIAANLDTVCVVQSLDQNFNLARLERYLAAIRAGGARPVVLLNKADLCQDAQLRRDAARAVAGNAPVHAFSAREDADIHQLDEYLQRGRTVAFVGSSGVGKSTLINRLIGREVQATAESRAADSRGRHTTVAREIFRLPGGALLLDTPGMRELQLWDSAGDPGAGQAAEDEFQDIQKFAADCRFPDCAHESEPDCAVLAALERGDLSQRRLRSYRKLRRESEYLASREDERGRIERKRKTKSLHRMYRRVLTEKRRRRGEE